MITLKEALNEIRILQDMIKQYQHLQDVWKEEVAVLNNDLRIEQSKRSR